MNFAFGLLRAAMGTSPGSRWSSCQCVEMNASARASSGSIGGAKARSAPKIALTASER